MPKRDKFYISAPSSALDPFRLTLKEDDIFGVFDRFGDILPLGKNEQGIYSGGTRFLSHYEVLINGTRPLFLSSNVDENNILLSADLTNPDIYRKGALVLDKDSIHIMRSRFFYDRKSHEHIRLRNFGKELVRFTLDIVVDADFKDIFEVRGLKRKKRGELLQPLWKDGVMALSYAGLDGKKRSTIFHFSRRPKPMRTRDKKIKFKVVLKPGESKEIFFHIACVEGEARHEEAHFDKALVRVRERLTEKRRRSTETFTSNSQFNYSVRRSLTDIEMMTTSTEYGSYPYGGVPWYCTPFGRDGIITALECLWIRPMLARGVLSYLAARQATATDKARAAEPGKILHETRSGELATLDEIPFGLYYGSIDSTPLFVTLAGAYLRRTGDKSLIDSIWPNIEAALNWLDIYGDSDGDGFLEYAPHEAGLRNQGWKDSRDSIFHANGRLAEGPIALAEVQAYLYSAKREGAWLAGLTARRELADRLSREAEILKEKFNRTFWDEELGSYILALDGEKAPCRVVASNGGHALFTGIADEDKARRMAKSLLTQDMFSGWGIRTVGAKEARYNPMSYHNGSVWPHDNALIAAGLASYGLTDDFMKVFSAIFDASLSMEFQRLPELYCGFHRREGIPPTLYPVACSPQTWASGALLLFIQASLGLHFEAEKKLVIFRKPVLPEFIDYLYLKELYVDGERTVDFHIIRRHGHTVAVEPVRKPEDVSVLIIK